MRGCGHPGCLWLANPLNLRDDCEVHGCAASYGAIGVRELPDGTILSAIAGNTTARSRAFRFDLRRRRDVPRRQRPSVLDVGLLRSPRSVGQGRADIWLFEVRVVSENVWHGSACRQRTENRAYSDAHAANTWLSPHDVGIVGHPCQQLHAGKAAPRPRPGRFSPSGRSGAADVGGSSGTRTHDLRIKSPQLYRLSYRPE